MDKDKVIKTLTSAIIEARQSLIFIYKDVSMVRPLSNSTYEAENAIKALEESLNKTFIMPEENEQDELH